MVWYYQILNQRQRKACCPHPVTKIIIISEANPEAFIQQSDFMEYFAPEHSAEKSDHPRCSDHIPTPSFWVFSLPAVWCSGERTRKHDIFFLFQWLAQLIKPSWYCFGIVVHQHHKRRFTVADAKVGGFHKAEVFFIADQQVWHLLQYRQNNIQFRLF